MVASASACLVGAVLLVRRPEHPVGWCFRLLGLLGGGVRRGQDYGLLGLVADPRGDHPGAGSQPLSWPAACSSSGSSRSGWSATSRPTGHYLSARWAWCARVMWIAGLIWFVTVLLMPTKLEAPFSGIENPWGIEALRGSPLVPVRSVTGVLTGLLVLVAFASLVVRFRRSYGEERRQLLWMGIAAVPVPVLVVVTFVAAKADNDVVLNLAAGGFVAVLPLAAGLAVAKTRLYDVDRILSQAVAYVLLSAVLAGTYAARGAARRSGRRRSRRQLDVAVAWPPSRWRPSRSRRTADAAGHGRPPLLPPSLRRAPDASGPRRVARPVDDVEQVLRDALRDPDLAVSYWVPDTPGVGDRRGSPRQIPLRRHDRAPRRADGGARVVGRAGGRVGRSRASRGRAGARQRRPACRGRASARGRTASRQRLATAQLDERRRIERDLHDGAQQRLLALAAQLQAALINGEPERLREALTIGVEQSQTAVRELPRAGQRAAPVGARGRRAWRPRSTISRRGTACGSPSPNRISAIHRVEATAWFIACEAVTNAVKHSGGGRHRGVRAAGRRQLHVVVEDDGLGGADPSGSGLRGLADRAEAVGGHLTCSTDSPRGQRSARCCHAGRDRRRLRPVAGGARPPLAEAGVEVCALVGDAQPSSSGRSRSTNPTWRSSTSGCRRPGPTKGPRRRAGSANGGRRWALLLLSQTIESRHAAALARAHPRGFGYLLKDHVLDVATLIDALATVEQRRHGPRPGRRGRPVRPPGCPRPAGRPVPARARGPVPAWPRVGPTPRPLDSCASPPRRSRAISPTSSPSSICCKNQTTTEGCSPYLPGSRPSVAPRRSMRRTSSRSSRN